MKLSIDISPKELSRCYQDLKSLLKGNDQIIFDAMVAASDQVGVPFQPPKDASEFPQKYLEIERRLNSRAVLRGVEVGLTLIDEVASRVKNGDAPTVSFDSVLDTINLVPNTGFELFLSPQLVWSARWRDEGIVLGIHERAHGEIIPSYVFEYINNSIAAYKNGLHFAAAAMISIVVEATLRDMLIACGYSYVPHASPVDVYKLSNAKVGVENHKYTISFPNPMPKALADFQAATGGNEIDVEIRRIIKQKSDGTQRVDLVLINPPQLIDHWSTDQIQQVAQKSIGGLGAALDIARNKEGILSASDLPTDFDKVIQIVRNNLIHLSGDILTTPLPDFPHPHDTLLGFLQDAGMIADLIGLVTQFVNQQYLKLKLGIT